MLGWSVGNDSGQGKAIAGLAVATDEIVVKPNVHVTIPVKSTVFDQGRFFNGDGKVYIQQDGIYIITGQIDYKYESSARGTRYAIVKKNGVDVIALCSVSPNSTSLGMDVACAVVEKLSKGDYLELVAKISTTSSVVVETTIEPKQSKISIARLGD